MKKGPPFNAIAFDCDSTLSSIEGIDELARRAGLGRDMQRLTADAMEGRTKLESVYGQRLEQVRPSRTAIRLLGNLYISRMVPGAGSTIGTLKRLEKKVFVVSGGIREAVEALAERLEIPGEDVFAVSVKHDEHGQYTGYEKRSPLTKSGGKAQVLKKLVGKYGPMAMVGDGITDMEAGKVPGVTFLGFGGVVQRPAVKDKAKLYVATPTLSPLLKTLLTEEEQEEAIAIAKRK